MGEEDDLDEKDPPRAERGGRFENSLGMRFLPLPASVGSEEDAERLLGLWETRVRDYRAFAERVRVRDAWEDVSVGDHVQGPDHPVVNISFREAVAFCDWLTKKERREGVIGPEDRYRLPTSAEWSRAAASGGRADERGRYPWGTAWPPPRGAGNYSGTESAFPRQIEEYRDAHPFTAPVGSYSPSRSGFYDLGGNVWEWCLPAEATADEAEARGGAWNLHSRIVMQTPFRTFHHVDTRNDFTGFRCLLEIGSRKTRGGPRPSLDLRN